MSLLNNIKTGAGGILSILEKINGAFMPSGNPISDPMLEEAAGPEATVRARELYRRQYEAQRAQAIQNGANVFNMDALASTGAQEGYSQSLARSAQAVDMLRERRLKTGRLDALKRMVEGIADPQKRALAEANPEGYAEAAVKDTFRPETENYSMTALGDGSFAVLDKRNGGTKIIKDPEIAAALRSGLANVQEAGGKLWLFGKNGQIINSIDVGPDPKDTAAAEKERHKVEIATRRQFDALPEVKKYKEVLPIIHSIAKAPKDAAGDLDFIYGVGKILDPESVVRESEMELVLNSAPTTARLLAQWGFQTGKNGRLTPEMRSRLLNVLQNRSDNLRAPYVAARDTYTGYAIADGYDPNKFVGPDLLDAFQTSAPKGADSTIEYVRDPVTGKQVRVQK